MAKTNHSFFTPRALTVLGLATLALQIAITLRLAPVIGPRSIARLQTTLSRDEFWTVVNAWTQEEHSIFLSHYYLDFLFPLAYGTFLAGLLSKAPPFRQRGATSIAVVVPILAAAMDQTENICQSALVRGDLELASTAFEIGAWSARLKFLFLGVSFALLAMGIFRRPRRQRIG